MSSATCPDDLSLFFVSVHSEYIIKRWWKSVGRSGRLYSLSFQEQFVADSLAASPAALHRYLVHSLCFVGIVPRPHWDCSFVWRRTHH